MIAMKPLSKRFWLVFWIVVTVLGAFELWQVHIGTSVYGLWSSGH